MSEQKKIDPLFYREDYDRIPKGTEVSLIGFYFEPQPKMIIKVFKNGTQKLEFTKYSEEVCRMFPDNPINFKWKEDEVFIKCDDHESIRVENFIFLNMVPILIDLQKAIFNEMESITKVLKTYQDDYNKKRKKRNES